MKRAVISMDVEDWYHLDYFQRERCDSSYSMLDGLDRFLDILETESVPATFFILGELATSLGDRLIRVAREHEVASHGWSHVRPLTLSSEQFIDDLLKSKYELEQVTGMAVQGFRAPCFSIDDERLQWVERTGYRYDSSRIDFKAHPLYGSLTLSGFECVSESGIYRSGNFWEFEVSTLAFGNHRFPVSGGGYLRMLPWMVTERFVSWYVNRSDFFVFYIHPYELSRLPSPSFPGDTSLTNRFRFNYGRPSVADKVVLLIRLLRRAGFEFCTFRDLCSS